jgi:hypothetical protein
MDPEHWYNRALSAPLPLAAKFHAISYCMKEGDSTSLLERYSKLREDSLYREDTYEFTNRLSFRTYFCCTEFVMLTQLKVFYHFCCSFT